MLTTKRLASVMLKRKLSQNLSESSELKITKVAPSNTSEHLSSNAFEDQFLSIQEELNTALKTLTFKQPVAYVYNPLEYAEKGNASYVRKYCKGPKKLVFVGMNPGPFGMCQTGVPFGAISSVRDWLGIEEEISKPLVECPERPIQGFACPRTEVSGDRLWNVFKSLSGTPDIFFKQCFVYNYCPLAFMKSNGGNLTPRETKDYTELENICDSYFSKIIQLLAPEIVVGIGAYAETRLRTITRDQSEKPTILRLVHPSPRVMNNNNWPEKAEKFLKDNNLLRFLKEDGAVRD